MSRAVVAGVAVVSIALAGCSGHNSAILPFASAPACPLLAQLAHTGQTVAHANVADPDEFEATLQAAVTNYLQTAERLQAAVPARLRADVQRMIVAVQARHFSEGERARSDIDIYARSMCNST